jgi:uncharacterized protein YjeT (DUF2065 family)
MADLMTALGLLLVAEGIFYALAADQMPRLLQMMRELGPERLRVIGVAAALVGVVIVGLARSL